MSGTRSEWSFCARVVREAARLPCLPSALFESRPAAADNDFHHPSPRCALDRDPEAFDWYQRYAGIKEQLTVYAEKTDRILNIGCGNSRAYCDACHVIAAVWVHSAQPFAYTPFPPLLSPCRCRAGVSEEMYEDGYTTIDNIDISDVVIQAMQAKHSDKTGLTWEVMDCTALNHPDGIYDVVFDKGTVDSLLCGEGSTAKVATVFSEISRVLKDDGTLFMVSYGIPDNRLSYLENADYNWTVKVHAIPKPTVTAVRNPPAPACATLPLPLTHHTHTHTHMMMFCAQTAMMESKDATSVHYIYVCSKGDESGK